jgi:DGQHR domain-containing protein
MICSCCGLEIFGKNHSVDGGKKYVCDNCWNNPDLFFPEKLEQDARLKLLSKMNKEKDKESDISKIKVIRLFQKGVEMYIGKVPAKTLLKLCDVDKFEEKELSGYQREVYRERTTELVEYLNECPIAVMPGLFASIRNSKFNPKYGDVGTLEIPNKKGAVWIIDGQHRLGGFEKIREKFVFEEKLSFSPELFKSLMDYEMPIVFINSKAIAKEMSSIDEEDLERAMFFIVNKTQKGINPSLKDALLYRIKMGGIKGIPALKKEKWRIQGAAIAISLNQDLESPLMEMINISGKRSQGKPIMLNSFVSSLQKILGEPTFSSLSKKGQLFFIRLFWTVLSRMIPEAFDAKTSKNYMLLKALGLHTLNWVAYDVIIKCKSENLNFFDEEIIVKILEPLKFFDWTTKTSPLATLGGMKGVNEAHRILLDVLNLNSAKDYPRQIKVGQLDNFVNPN